MANIKDVAKLANVSVATVSRVINGMDNVTGQTKDNVLAAVKALNYSPNNLARNLRRLQSKCILIFLNSISNEFFSSVIKGIEDEASGKYNVLLCMTHGDDELELRYLNLLKTKMADGAIFLLNQNEGSMLNKELVGIPCVQASEYDKEFETSYVTIDNEKAGYDAINHLISKGYKEIAFFGNTTGKEGSSTLRYKGYERALKENGINILDDMVFDLDYGVENARIVVQSLMSRNKLPDAIFCTSDNSAIGIIKEFNEKGINVPLDIAVMGFDDTDSSKNYIPSISTVSQPRYEIGRKSMEILAKKLETEDESLEKIILEHKIIDRQSTN